jgi:hypothetical protein
MTDSYVLYGKQDTCKQLKPNPFNNMILTRVAVLAWGKAEGQYHHPRTNN